MSSFVQEQDYKLPNSRCRAKIACYESSKLAVIVTHPWGPLGGNMDNNVIIGVCRGFQSLNVTTLRLDFSGLQIGTGSTQVDQVKEAADFLTSGNFLKDNKKKNVSPPKRILLIGYSYGSIISAGACSSIPQCIGVVWIAPALGPRHLLYLFAGNKHLEEAKKRTTLKHLMIMGSEDNFTSVTTFMGIVNSMPETSTTSKIMNNVDHFFLRRERALMAIIGDWILTIFPQCNNDLRLLSTLDLPSVDMPTTE